MWLIKIFSVIFVLVFIIACSEQNTLNEKAINENQIKNLIIKHKQAWEEGGYKLLDSILHEDVVFAYPGRRLNKQETLKDLVDYNNTFKDTEIYINKIIIDGNDLAVEWQFASTNKKTGIRTAVSDAIIGKVKDGKIIVWKEYLDGRVSRMQVNGTLSLDEGEESFPWPKKK